MKFHFGFLSMGDNGAITFNLTAAVSTAGLAGLALAGLMMTGRKSRV